MRSRYSAFVLDRLGYLLATWHPSTRPPRLEPSPAGQTWLGLEVRRPAPGDDNPGNDNPGNGTAGHDASHATVEFVARSKLAGRAHRLHEVSRFVREQGHWYYLDGTTR